MRHHNSVFHAVLQGVPWDVFDQLVRAHEAAWMCPSLRESIYRLTWRSVTRLPDIQSSPAIAGEHCSPQPQRTPTGHCSCRQAATVIVAAHEKQVESCLTVSSFVD